MNKRRKYSEDDDDDLFVIEKSKPRKSTKKSGKPMQRLKRNDSDDDYQPQLEKDSSSSDLQPSSDQEKITNKRKRNQKSTTTNQKEQKKSKKQEKRDTLVKKKDQIQETQESLIRQPEEYYLTLEQSLPTFLQPDYIRDAEGNRPDSPNYDPTTVDIPIEQQAKFTPIFRQYWNAKKNHFDSIVFFRCGWVTVMYNDAIILGKLFNRNLWFWGRERPCLTVYDSQLPIYERIIVEKGYKILMVEQIEKADIANKEEGQIIKREITSIISRGTIQDLEDNDSYESRNLLVLVCTAAPVNLKGKVYQYGLAIVDCTTNNFFFDQFLDDEQSNLLRSVIYKIKPAEAIYCKVPEDVKKMIRTICNPTVIISNREFCECEYIFEQMKYEFQEEKSIENKKSENQQKNTDDFDISIPKYYIQPEIALETDVNQGVYSEKKENQIFDESTAHQNELSLSGDYPILLQELEKQYLHEKKNSENQEEAYYFSYYYALQAFYIQLCYLRKLLISTTVYRRGRFSFLDTCFSQKRNLYLDSQALESLEIFEVNLQTRVTNQGSLFNYLDKCSTPYGKRLLTKWVQNPLLECKEIMERQESIQDLMNNIEPCEEFQKRLKSLPDLERAIIKCFNTIHSHKLKIVPITGGGESYGKIKLKEIASVIKNIKASSEAFKVFDKYLPKFKSIKLKKMVNSQDIAKSLTNIFKDLEKCLIIKDGEPQPVQGVSPEYDTALEKLTIITDKLDEELNKWKQILKCPDIVYHHGKIKYQLEIPDKYIDGIKKPKELVITSKKKGYQRFQTEIIEQQIYKLKVVEDELSSKLLPFINEYFTKFYSYRKELLQLISSLSTLDSLISLALVSKNQNISCFPQIIELDPDEEIDSQFNLQEGFHPCLLQNREIEWISNSIKFSNQIDTLLLTGPNMSGKSTLLRLIGVSIILAQIGCAVPAKSFQLIPFDRIFCRLGASDRLLEGKSTFFIELEETKTILENCTNRSLVIIDELGRGTSTYDGVALASAVLRYLSQKIRPKTLFATHYHILLDEFALFKNIQQCVMKHYQQGDKVIFEYKLINGAAQKSFAANVAKIAGIPNEVVQRAKEMEEKITKEESKINKNRDILKKFNKIVENLF